MSLKSKIQKLERRNQKLSLIDRDRLTYLIKKDQLSTEEEIERLVLSVKNSSLELLIDRSFIEKPEKQDKTGDSL